MVRVQTVNGPVDGVEVSRFSRDGVTYLVVRDKDGGYHVYPESKCEQLS